MTKKELLATEYVNLKKEFDGPDFKAGIRAHDVHYLATHFKVSDLEDKICHVEMALKEKNKRLANEAYWETPEGKEKKIELETKLNAIINTRRTLKENTENDINLLVYNILGKGWTSNYCGGYGSGNVEIGLANTDPARDKFKFEFGHTFTIYWDLNNFGSGEKFEMNYGCLGAFDLNEAGTRQKYLKGMGELASNKLFLDTIKKLFIETNKKNYELDKEARKLRDMLEKPLNYINK